MVTITKLQVDTISENLVVSANDDNTDKYQFTKIYIDSIKTFNCKNEPSTLATTVELKDSSTEPYAENTPLSNYKIPFNEIICSDVPENDIFFVWVECDEQYNRDEYNGYYYDNNFYITDGKNYYHTVTLNASEVFEDEDASDYNYAKNHSSDVYAVKTFRKGHYIYVKETYGGNTYYFRINDESLATGGVSITETVYNEARAYMAPNTAFGVTLSVKNFYELLLNHIDIESSTDNCKVDCADVNFMLAWQGFNLAKTLQDYNQMIYYWNILHRYGNNSSTVGCGCNK